MAQILAETTRLVRGRTLLRPGPAGDIQHRPSPVGGGYAGHWKWRVPLISTGLLKIISDRHAENPKRPGKPASSDRPSPAGVCRMASMPAKPRMLRSSPRSPCARKKDQWISAGTRIVTTSCADRPASSPLRKAVSTILGNLGDGPASARTADTRALCA